MDELIDYARAMAMEYPQHKSSILDIVDMARHEVYDGESEDNEVQLAIGSIDELIQE
jgi:hypothetical protein